MPNATPSQIAMTSEALKKLQEERRKEQEEFRKNPAKLAAAIAEQIRLDNHANEDPENYENGAMHWFQHTWGNVRARFGDFAKLTKPLQSSYDNHPIAPEDHGWFEVSCPTTGCIAGWADSLAGYPLVFKKDIGWQDRDYYEEHNPDITEEEIVLEFYNEGEVIQIEHCYDPVLKKVRDIADVAYELLNLGGEQKSWLFNGERNKDEVLWALDHMASGNQDWDGNECPFIEVEEEYEDEYNDEDVNA